MGAFWDPAVIWGTVAIGVFILLTVVVGVFLISTDRDGGRGWDFICWVAILTVEAVVLVAIWFPFQTAYLKYVPVTGTVQTINSRFLSDGSNSVTQKYAVQFKGGGIYGCLDTRCSVVRPGEKLTLDCIKEWQFGGPAGYNCKWDQLATKTGTVIG